MAIPHLIERTVSTSDLFLDPNNPRFLDLAEDVRLVPPERVAETRVQENALRKILNPLYDIKQLKDSISNIGFLRVDRLVVLPLPQEGRFVVVEGNRRLAAVKSLLNEHNSGEITLDEGILSSLESLSVVVLDSADGGNRDHAARILQGVRHVARVRDWGPYQQAQLIAIMIEDGKEPNEIKEVLGLSMQRLNQLSRGYNGLKQMREDTDFEEHASPRLFSYFDEALKRPKVREWMQWNPESLCFLDEANRRKFYELITGEDQDGQRLPPRLSDPKNIRDLDELMEDPVRFRQFLDTPTLSLQDAMRGVVIPERKVDWRGSITQLINMIQQIPAVDLVKATEEDLKLLENVEKVCASLIRQAAAMK